MDAYDNLSPIELERIRRFIEVTGIDADAVSDDFRELVEMHWPWLLPKLAPPTRH